MRLCFRHRETLQQATLPLLVFVIVRLCLGFSRQQALADSSSVCLTLKTYSQLLSLRFMRLDIYWEHLLGSVLHMEEDDLGVWFSN